MGSEPMECAASPAAAPSALPPLGPPPASDAVLREIAAQRALHPAATAKELHALLTAAGVAASLPQVKKMCSRLSASSRGV